MKQKTLLLHRLLVRGDITEGELRIGGHTVCQTLENSHTRLPAGRYPIRLVKCPLYERQMPLVGSAKLRCRQCRRPAEVTLDSRLSLVCPMLKPGHGIRGRTDGSILLGTRAALGLLVNALAPFNRLCDRIRKLLQRGCEVTLEIV